MWNKMWDRYRIDNVCEKVYKFDLPSRAYLFLGSFLAVGITANMGEKQRIRFIEDFDYGTEEQRNRGQGMSMSMCMTRHDVKEEIEELRAETELLSHRANNFVYIEMIEENIQDILLLSYAVAHASDEDLRIAQLACPGRSSVMAWAKRYIPKGRT